MLRITRGKQMKKANTCLLLITKCVYKLFPLAIYFVNDGPIKVIVLTVWKL